MSGKTENYADMLPYRQGNSIQQFVISQFHQNRLDAIEEFIGEHETVLSVGCRHGELEAKLLDRIDTLYGLDINRGAIAEAKSTLGIDVIHGSVPPIPMEDDSLDALLTIGTLEHLPDEEAFISDATRVLRPGGEFIATVPIEAGIGGLIRYLGRCFVDPTSGESPDDWTRYFDYSWEELTKDTPRGKHGTRHRYYNYTYALEDIKENFDNVKIGGWPLPISTNLNFLFIIKATLD